MAKGGDGQRPWGADRDALLRRIADEYAETAQSTGKPTMDPRVREALLKVPREEFVAAGSEDSAYLNAALSIGYGQTISQPFIVAIMTDLLELKPDSVVLEVGTGCGYQAAVLAEIARKVYSVEVIPELAAQAAARLRRLGYGNVQVRCSDGFSGWPENGPYDAIIVTAAAAEIPPPLLEQLKPGGRMVVPLGRPYAHQDLTVVTKDADGRIAERAILPVAFVPLVHEKDRAS